ncbi:MAG: methylenetetrahydrofolate reductase [NAD(P)H] [Chloroflexota bacterium]|nr:methylenetetrahydrofolate reductase [NAD(P)H] [Chloroflexota bacterium]MDE3193160.1 methylenetetrahydrofolate reductase [NAD(P)H] [Chloroflexota bacterium]
MRIADAYRSRKPVFSFEFFPPKDERGMHRLHDTIAALRPLRPDFVSVTYGAGGTTRELTVELVTEIKRDTGIEAMAHLTCVGSTADEIAEVLDRFAADDVENVIALRGDPPKGEARFTPVPGGFAHGSELATFIKSRWPFCVAGAAYPEGHVESASADDDIRYAKAKQDAGVDVLITQLFFDPHDYFRFVTKARAAGVTIPIVPGVMPITSAAQLAPTGMFARSGARVPEALRHRVEAARDDEAVQAVGLAWALGQCRKVLEAGAPGIHFYTLNRSHAAYRVYHGLRTGLPATVGAR